MTGRITNLSVGGLYLECAAFFAVGERVLLKVALPAGGLQCWVRVLRVLPEASDGHPAGMGLQFERLTPIERALLMHTVDGARRRL